jgi:hypothetical protein
MCLHIAAYFGWSEIVEALLAAAQKQTLNLNIFTNLKNQGGLSPLLLAIARNHESVAKILLDNGADLSFPEILILRKPQDYPALRKFVPADVSHLKNFFESQILDEYIRSVDEASINARMGGEMLHVRDRSATELGESEKISISQIIPDDAVGLKSTDAFKKPHSMELEHKANPMERMKRTSSIQANDDTFRKDIPSPLSIDISKVSPTILSPRGGGSTPRTPRTPRSGADRPISREMKGYSNDDSKSSPQGSVASPQMECIQSTPESRRPKRRLASMSMQIPNNSSMSQTMHASGMVRIFLRSLK